MDTAAQEVIERWCKGALRDRETARGMLRSGYYDWSLFVFHLALEKLLKAVLLKKSGEVAPIHDLRRLAELAKIDTSEQERAWLREITTFNLEARYEEEKFKFYKRATREYAREWHEKCEELFLWLEKMVKN